MARPIEDELLPSPVQCETNPTGSNGVVVFDDIMYNLHSVSSWEPDYYEDVRNRRNIHYVSSVADSTGVGRGLEQRWSSDLRNHVTDNREIWHHGHLLCGSCNAHRPHCPSCLTETTHRRAVTWWSLDNVGMKDILILLLICVTSLLFVIINKL